jgi:hypothetical protein
MDNATLALVASSATWQIAGSISAIITPVILLVGAIIAYIQWSSMRNSRMAQLVDSLGAQWNSEEMTKARQAVNDSGRKLKADMEKADTDNNLKLYTDYSRVANFFDELGILVSEGFIKCSIVWLVWGKAEQHYYKLYEGIINSEENKGYYPSFIKLNKLITKEEACQTRPKSKHAS